MRAYASLVPATGEGGGVARVEGISVSQILCEIFERNLFGAFKDLPGCTLGCATPEGLGDDDWFPVQQDAIRSPPGNEYNRPLFLMSTLWEPRMICPLIFQKWHGVLSCQNV